MRNPWNSRSAQIERKLRNITIFSAVIGETLHVAYAFYSILKLEFDVVPISRKLETRAVDCQRLDDSAK